MRRAVAASLIVLAACGGGPSKVDFVARVEALCRRAAAEQAALPEVLSADEYAGYLGGLAEVVRKERRAVARVDAPADGRDEQRALLRSLDRVARAADRFATATDGFSQQEQLDAAALARHEADGKLVAYGFEDCARS
ncbi:MAG: hypothetical protein JWN67_114 [Actinomycetia bacterium]|nr:hypothetical protein [Actinomycetes bacterium]